MLATIVAITILGGLLPVSAAVNDISTVAGRPDSGDGGAATSALVRFPRDVAVDSAGNAFIADTWNHRIRRVSTTGIMTTVAGNGTSGYSGDGGPATSAQLRFPQGVWVDGGGNLYIADHRRIRKVDTSGTITTVAGNGTAGFSGDGGPATAAQLNDPKDITTDGAGNLYIADNENHRIRKVSPAGTISTFAGNGIEGYAGDGGAATSARLNDPTGVAFNTGSGDLYIADTDNNRIRQVSSTGTITTYVGDGTAGDQNHAQLSKSKIDSPERMSYGSGGLFFADTDNHKVKFVTTAISTVAGDGVSGFSGDGGSATSARLDEPTGVASISGGAFLVADSDNHRVRRVSSGIITTYAGRNHYGGDGGPAIDAALDIPFGLDTDSAGNFFIADTGNHRIRRVSGGTITTVAGTGSPGFSGDGGSATSAQLSTPFDVAVDTDGNVYIADAANDRVRKVDPGGTITTVAGNGTAGFSGDGGPATTATLDSPIGLDVDVAGNLYIADLGNHRIRMVDTSGTITTVAGNGTESFCGDGGAATSACLDTPTDADVDAAGNLYIADYGNHRIREVTAGTIRTVAGSGSGFTSGDGGAATSAGLPTPIGLAVDGAGNMLIASSFAGRIRKVDLAGTITTVAGYGSFGFSGDGGPAVSAEMAFPARVALDAEGNFYIADTYNNRIRMVEGLGALPGPTMGGTTPASPANDNSPLVFGTAEPETTVTIYTDSACSGPAAGTGSDAEFASPGLTVTVPDDSTTTFYATATNDLGQVSACSMSSVTYIEDSTPPGPPTITLAPASPGSDTSPSWSFTTDAGATAECELSRGVEILSPYAPCTSPATYDLTGEPDGDYTFSVRATDTAGNTGSPASDTYALDSTVPGAVEITSSPGSPSNDPAPTWEFTVDAGSTAECEWSYEGTVLEAFAPCTSPKTHDLSGQPDGNYTLRVLARDGAGNPSAPVSSVYTFDTTAPGAPTIDSGPASPGNSTSPVWTFTVEAGATAECELRRGGTVVSGWQPCASPKSYNLSGEPDGDYDFGVRAVDAAGNTSAAATSSYTLDTSGPVVTINSSPSSPDNDPNPSWTFSTEVGATLECELRRDQTVVSTWASCVSPDQHDLSAQPDGTYTFRARATDAAGNTGAPAGSVYVLDRTAPLVSIDSGPAPVSSELNPEWGFSSEAGVTIECQLSSDTGGILQPFAPCVSPQSYDLTGQPDDTYTFSARATDPAGNLGPASSSGYYLDTSGPASSITSSPSSPGNTRSPSWSFTAEAGATTECELSAGASILSPYAPCASPTSFSLSGQPDGAYTFSVRATDVAGNVGAPASNTYTLDTTAPAAPTITSAPASPGSSQSPSWSFTTELGATTECELSRSGVVLSAWGSCLSPAVFDLTGQPDGDYTFRVRATDGVGNTSPATVSVYTLDTTGPSVNVVPPSSPGNDPTPTWSFSTEAGATTQCELSNGASVLQPFSPCSSPVTYDLAGRPDGGYTVRIRATDAVGNTGPVTSSTYVLDTAGPAVTIVSGPQSPGSGKTPSWSFTTEAGATARCELSRGTTVLDALAPCASPKGYDITGEPDGTYTFRVRATDTAGNTGPASTANYTFDGTAPAVPVITSAPASPGTATSVTWAFSVEAGASAECELTRDASVVRPFAACGTPKTYDIGGEPDGSYTFRVRAIDALGNTSSPAVSTYTLDTTGPEVTITSAPTSPGQLTDPTWAFTAEVGATTRCSLARAGIELSPPGSCTSPVSFDLVGEPDDTYTFRASATDPLGNAGPVAGSTYVLATAPQGGGGGSDDGKGGGKDKDDDGGTGTDDGGTGSDGVTEQPTGTSDPVSQPEDGSDVAAPVGVTDRGDDRGDRGLARESSADEEPTEDLVPSPEDARELAEASTRRPSVLGELLDNLRTLAAGLLEQPAFPLSLISVVFGFLVLQNRVDRRDPKLAMAPVYPDPHLYFESQEGPGKAPLPSGGAVKGPMT